MTCLMTNDELSVVLFKALKLVSTKIFVSGFEGNFIGLNVGLTNFVGVINCSVVTVSYQVPRAAEAWANALNA